MTIECVTTKIEKAAMAIRAIVAARIGTEATPWERLEEYQRIGYREEAIAALKVFESK